MNFIIFLLLTFIASPNLIMAFKGVATKFILFIAVMLLSLEESNIFFHFRFFNDSGFFQRPEETDSVQAKESTSLRLVRLGFSFVVVFRLLKFGIDPKLVVSVLFKVSDSVPIPFPFPISKQQLELS